MNDSAAVHLVLLGARDAIPLAANFADDAHKAWVRAECRKQRVWIDEREVLIAGVLVMRAAEIFYLVTAPEFRGRGVGTGLVEHAVAYIGRRYSCGVTARVREANVRSSRFSPRKGSTPIHSLRLSRDGSSMHTAGCARRPHELHPAYRRGI